MQVMVTLFLIFLLGANLFILAQHEQKLARKDKKDASA